jgi:hypothetical protein
MWVAPEGASESSPGVTALGSAGAGNLGAAVCGIRKLMNVGA